MQARRPGNVFFIACAEALTMMSDTAADPALAQVPVGEEGELERRDRALDRHVDQVHDQPPAIEALERTAKRVGALGAVEGEDALVPAWTREPLGLLRLQPHAGRDDEYVVREHGPVVEQHLVALDPDGLDLVLVEDDAVAELPAPRPDDLLDLGEPEGHEQQAGLIHMPVVAVDDVDLRLVLVEAAPQPVGGHRPARSAAEDDDPLPAHDGPPAGTGSRWCAASPRSSIRSTNTIPLSIERPSGHVAATFSRRSSCASLSSPVSRMSTSKIRGVP